jgi:hypothetical protein
MAQQNKNPDREVEGLNLAASLYSLSHFLQSTRSGGNDSIQEKCRGAEIQLNIKREVFLEQCVICLS